MRILACIFLLLSAGCSVNTNCENEVNKLAKKYIESIYIPMDPNQGIAIKMDHTMAGRCNLEEARRVYIDALEKIVEGFNNNQQIQAHCKHHISINDSLLILSFICILFYNCL